MALVSPVALKRRWGIVEKRGKELDRRLLESLNHWYSLLSGRGKNCYSLDTLMLYSYVGVVWGREGTRSLSVKDGKHRVVLPDRHYDLVRRYMVVKRLPSARAAVLEMIEAAIVLNGKEQFRIDELEEASPAQHRGEALVV